MDDLKLNIIVFIQYNIGCRFLY